MKKSGFISIFCLLLIGGAIALSWMHSTRQGLTKSNVVEQREKVQQNFGQLPLLFVENQGQWDEQVAYAIQGSDKTLYFASDGVTIALSSPVESKTDLEGGLVPDLRGNIGKPIQNQRYTVKLDFIGANSGVRPIGQEPDTAVISYFKGQPDEWHTGLSTYRRIVYPNLWPGIDLVYEGNVNRLKYHFLVQPGADPSQIHLAYRGATNVTLNEANQLVVETPLGSFEDDTPIAYQEVNGQRVMVDMGYELDEGTADSQPYHFSLGNYDPSLPLILDPVLIVYSGYIGGSGFDWGNGIDIDDAGNAYITGYTDSSEATFPTAVGPDLTQNGSIDAFVVKVNSTGTSLIYAGYIGGSGNDNGQDIVVDDTGNAFVSGYTVSTETTFPTTIGPDLTYNGGGDAFIAKINPTGDTLLLSGYLGGDDVDSSTGIDLDSSGNIYISGITESTETTFPVAVGPDLTQNGDIDGFVAKIDSSGTAIVYAGYIGGDNDDRSFGIAVDENENAYITGYTLSDETTFPVVVGPDLTFNGQVDAYVSKVNPSGSGLVYSGFIGGSLVDEGFDIALNSNGNAYIIGNTVSDENTFPVTVGPDLTYNGDDDSFVAQISVSGESLIYAGYIGGDLDESGYGIAVGPDGSAYVTGETSSTQFTFPVVLGPDLTYNGNVDIFVAKVHSSGASLVYAGYIGGNIWEYGYDIAVDNSGNVYITGLVVSGEGTFPVLNGPDLTHNGETDAYVTKISPEGPPNPPQSVAIDGPVTGVTGTDYVFTATTSPVTTTIPITYNWQATDQTDITQPGGLQNTAVYSWTSAGPKTITVTASNITGTVTNTFTLDVYESVSADFSAAPLSGTVPLTVTIANLSTGDFESCFWSFGDDGESNDCDPGSYTYQTPGIYTISLTISGLGGSDVVIKNDYIVVLAGDQDFEVYLPIILNP